MGNIYEKQCFYEGSENVLGDCSWRLAEIAERVYINPETISCLGF